jgi:hypothetical protein
MIRRPSGAFLVLLAAFLLFPEACAWAASRPLPTRTPVPAETPEKVFKPDPVTQDHYVRFAGQMLREIAAIRGLPVKREVPILFKDKEFFRKYFSRQMREDFPPKKLQPILKAYQAMGLYDPTGVKDPYEEEVEGVLTSIRGLYDPEKKAVYIAEWTDPSDWDDLVAHELAHALQDQYHDLKGYMDSLKELPASWKAKPRPWRWSAA